MKKFELKRSRTKGTGRTLRAELKDCLLPSAYCLLLFALSACQNSGRDATADALTAPIHTPTSGAARARAFD